MKLKMAETPNTVPENPVNKMKIIVKTPKEKKDIELEEDGTVEQVAWLNIFELPHVSATLHVSVRFVSFHTGCAILLTLFYLIFLCSRGG